MALSLSIPFPSAGSSVSATYHNVIGITGSKAPDAVNGANNWVVEFLVGSYASQTDRANGVPPLFSTRKVCSSVAMDQPVLPQLYASLLVDPQFVGAVSS